MAIVPQLFLATLLGSGFCLLIMLIVLWINSVIPEGQIVHEKPTFADSLVFLTDGTPLIACRTNFGKAWKEKNNISLDDNVILSEQRSSPGDVAYSMLSFHTLDGKTLLKEFRNIYRTHDQIPQRQPNSYIWIYRTRWC